MSEPWIVYLLIFASVVLFVQMAQVVLREFLQRERRATKRFGALDRNEQLPLAADGLRKRALGGPASSLLSRLQLLILQSGTEMTLLGLGRWLAIAWLAFFLLPLPWSGWVRFFVSGLAAGAIVYSYLSFKRSRRIARFAEQLPDVIDVIVRSLRAGHPLPVSLALVAREMPKPAGPEFAAIVDEINYGRSVGEALENLASRIGYRELRFFVSSIVIAQQTGGNLAEILARLAKMLRERFRLTRKIRALSAEGRISGYALTSLPILLFGLIHLASSTYYDEFWQSDVKVPVFLVAGGLLLIGNITIYKLVHFKV